MDKKLDVFFKDSFLLVTVIDYSFVFLNRPLIIRICVVIKNQYFVWKLDFLDLLEYNYWLQMKNRDKIDIMQ